MSVLRVNSIETIAGASQYTQKVWMNLNGTGSVALRNSGNISGIVDNATGDYTVNFTNNTTVSTYACLFGVGKLSNSGFLGVRTVNNEGTAVTKTTSAVRLTYAANGGGVGAAELYMGIIV